MTFIKQTAVAISSAALLFSTVGVVGATNTTDISNTGAKSINKVTVTNKTVTSVVQKNVSSVKNSISIGANTGGNKANKNTGDGSADSGNVSVNVLVANGGSVNAAMVDNPCDCLDEDVETTISDTGYKSINKVTVKKVAASKTKQANFSKIANWLNIFADSGHNQSSQNTGDGTAESDDVTVDIEVVNEASSNILE